MSPADWSKLKSLMQTCDACGKDFPKGDLTVYKGKSYCNVCLTEVKASEKIACDGCGKEFDPSDITVYYKRNLCPQCLIEEKERRKNRSTQSKIESTVNLPEYDKRIEELKEEIAFLKQLILGSSSQVDAKKSDAINDVLLDLSSLDFDLIVEEIMNKYDLKKFDKGQGMNNFFYNMNRIKREKEIMSDPDKFKAARFINRIKRGDGLMYRMIFALTKQRIIDALRNIR